MADRRLTDLLRRRPTPPVSPPQPPGLHSLSDPIWDAVRTDLANTSVGDSVPPFNQNQAALEAIYGSHPLVTACIRANSSEAHSVPWKLRAHANGTTEEVETHEILDVLARPNPKTHDSTLRLWLGMQVENFGQSFLTIDKGIAGNTELWPMPASRVTIIPGDDVEPVRAYAYHAQQGVGASFIGGTHSAQAGQVSTVAAEDVIHSKYPNPWASDYYHGFSKVRELWTMLRRSAVAEQWLQKFFEQGAVIPYAIEATNELSEVSYQRLKDTIKENLQGVQNFAKPFLAEAARVRKIGATIAEADPSSLESAVEDRILAAMGTPRTALFLPGGNFATAREATRLWYRRTIMPLNEVLLDAINTSRFVTVFNSERIRFELYADYSGVEALQKDRAAQATADSIYLTHGVADPDNPERLADALAVKAERADKFLQGMGPPPADSGNEREGPEDTAEDEPQDRGEDGLSALIAVGVWGRTPSDTVIRGASMGFLTAAVQPVGDEFYAPLLDVPQCSEIERKGMLSFGVVGMVRNGNGR